MEFVYLNKMKNFEESLHKESETKFYHLVQVWLEEPGREGPGEGPATGGVLPRGPGTVRAWVPYRGHPTLPCFTAGPTEAWHLGAQEQAGRAGPRCWQERSPPLTAPPALPPVTRGKGTLPTGDAGPLLSTLSRPLLGGSSRRLPSPVGPVPPGPLSPLSAALPSRGTRSRGFGFEPQLCA